MKDMTMFFFSFIRFEMHEKDIDWIEFLCCDNRIGNQSITNIFINWNK